MQTLDIDSLTLTAGSHTGLDDGFCLMEAVAYIAGEPWSDKPQCVSPVIAAFLRSYNDSVNDEVRQSLKQYIPRLVGTQGSAALEERRSFIADDWLVRVYTPAWLRLAGLTDHADALVSLPEITSMDQIPSIKGPIKAARDSAFAAASGARARPWARAAARAAAWSAAVAAAGAAVKTRAASVVWGMVGAAVWDAAGVAIVTGIDLQPTKDALQATIPALIERMLTATNADGDGR